VRQPAPGRPIALRKRASPGSCGTEGSPFLPFQDQEASNLLEQQCSLLRHSPAVAQRPHGRDTERPWRRTAGLAPVPFDTKFKSLGSKLERGFQIAEKLISMSIYQAV
jgi:hypothetical protein